MQATPAQCQLGQLSTPTPEFTLLLQTCTYTRTHISISIIYTCGIRTADERDLGLKLCKQQQLLPIPTTTKGRRSPEVRWVPGNWRARNNQRVRKQEEQKPSPCRGGAEGAQALLRQTEGNHKQDGQEHAGLARAGQRHVVTRVRQRTRDMPPQEEGLGQGSALCRAELEAGILECDLGGSPEYAPLHVVLKHFPQLFSSPKLPSQFPVSLLHYCRLSLCSQRGIWSPSPKPELQRPQPDTPSLFWVHRSPWLPQPMAQRKRCLSQCLLCPSWRSTGWYPDPSHSPAGGVTLPQITASQKTERGD